MALNTYANLKASIRTWSKRNDLVDTQIDDFIDLCESTMYSNEEEVLEIREEETRSSSNTSTSTRYLSLPTGYIRFRSLHIVQTSGNTDVIYMGPESLIVYNTVGLPRYYTVTDQIELDRVSDTAYSLEMNYLKSFTALSDSNTTNSVLTNYPQIYLFGSLWAAALFTRQEELGVFYWKQFISQIKGANKKTRKGRYGPAPAMRIEGDTP